MTSFLHQSDLCKVRTITAFITLSKEKDAWTKTIIQTAAHLGTMMGQIQKKGYTVQSLRLVTNPFGQYLDTSSQAAILADMEALKQILTSDAMPDVRIRFAIGEAQTPAEIDLIPALIQQYGDLANICVNVEADVLGIPNHKKSVHAAQIIQRLSTETPRGEGNFNFTVNYNCDSYIPYFPASYHRGEAVDSFVLGFESPDLLLAAAKSVPANRNRNAFLSEAYAAMQSALQHHVDQVVPIANTYAAEHDFPFLGIDSSAAPSKDCASLVDVFQALGVPYFGAAGSVEASALLTRVFKSITGVPLVGFSGLMLAATEDTGLARDAAQGKYDIRTFLMNSAVCGIGLDTVPVEGDTSIEKMALMMQDTGTMAYRLNKPLTVRLFPAPGKTAGDITEFQSDDLCNCGVLRIP